MGQNELPAGSCASVHGGRHKGVTGASGQTCGAHRVNMLTETLRFTSVKPNIKIIWWVRLKFPVLSFHGVSSPPPPFRAQQSLLLFCCALQKCVLGWVRAGLPGSSVTAFGSHQTAGKNAYCWGLAAPFTHLEGSPSDSLVIPWDCFFLNRRIIENIRLERTSGGHLVQSPAQSFTIT